MSNNVLSSKKKKVIHDEGVIKYVHKTDVEKGGANADIADKGRWGVGKMLTLADKGGRGGVDPPIFG